METPPSQHRRTLRLPQHNYAGGVYYVTQATQHRRRLFGALANGRVLLSPAGQMVHDVWQEIPRFCPAYAVDEFIVIPDHIHGIVRVDNRAVDAQTLRHHDYREISHRRGAPPWAPAANGGGAHTEGCPDSATLFDFVHRLKSLTTARYIHGVRAQQWPRFDGALWQREYYEHIVRNDAAELRRIRAYIRDNPAHANLKRFGELRYYGNRALLTLRKTAYLASRGTPPWAPAANGDGAPTEGHPDGDACPDYAMISKSQCVISGFLSPLERDVLRFCRRRGIPTIHVLPHGFREAAPLTERELVATPFDSSVSTASQERAAWCNQYVLEHADEILVGQLKPDGLLAFLLTDLPRSLPVTVLSA